VQGILKLLRDLKTATGFPGQKNTLISRLKEADLRPPQTAVKECLTDERKLYLYRLLRIL